MNRFGSLRLIALCLTSSLMAASSSFADTSDAASIEYRQKLMSVIGANMGAIGDVLKNGLDLPGAVANHAGQMAEAAALIAPAFEKSIQDGATDARPEIWTDWARFEEAIAGYEAAARNLATAASEGNPGQIGSAMRALGKSCGSCHKPFRKPKEESYKNR